MNGLFLLQKRELTKFLVNSHLFDTFFKDTTDDDEIEVIYHLQPEKDQQDRKPPVSETKGLGFDLGNIVQDFISGNVPKSRRLDKIEKNLDLGASGRNVYST